MSLVSWALFASLILGDTFYTVKSDYYLICSILVKALKQWGQNSIDWGVLFLFKGRIDAGSAKSKSAVSKFSSFDDSAWIMVNLVFFGSMLHARERHFFTALPFLWKSFVWSPLLSLLKYHVCGVVLKEYFIIAIYPILQGNLHQKTGLFAYA